MLKGMRTRDLLLKRIKAHLARTGQTERQFGIAVTGDHKWMGRLRRGQVSLSSIERAEELITGAEGAPAIQASNQAPEAA
jgi:ligand-binding sensor domain-containing protein